MPNFRDKVVPLAQVGELDEESLGLKKDDVNLVISKVSDPNSTHYSWECCFYRRVGKKFMVMATQ